MPTCPVCNKQPANKHPLYGLLPCNSCNKGRMANLLPSVQVEFTTQTIKEQRREYARSIIQPYRSGELSKEYLDLYGTKSINPTKQEIKKAKNVWKDTFSHNFDLGKSK